jgi:biotin carboxyl carrier protein
MPWVIIEHDGKRHRVAVARDGRGVWVGYAGGAARVEPQRTAAAATHKEGDVQAPLTGKVINVEVAVGDEVGADAVLVVLEAMKMEYRLTSPKAGTVQAVHCATGDLVDQGTTLVELT